MYLLNTGTGPDRTGFVVACRTSRTAAAAAAAACRTLPVGCRNWAAAVDWLCRQAAAVACSILDPCMEVDCTQRDTGWFVSPSL